MLKHSSIAFVAVISLLTLSAGCSYQRSNELVKGFGDSGWESRVEEVNEEQAESRAQVAELAKKQHGLMHIHRYGSGYDVLLTLDAGDSDVKFVMDLPVNGTSDATTDMALQESAAVEPESEDTTDIVSGQEADDLLRQKLAEAEALSAQGQNQADTTTKFILSAQSMFYKKQYWKALEETNKALKSTPDSAQAHALKGSIYYKMGLIPEARKSWQKALQLDPSLDQVKTSLARING